MQKTDLDKYNLIIYIIIKGIQKKKKVQSNINLLLMITYKKIKNSI